MQASPLSTIAIAAFAFSSIAIAATPAPTGKPAGSAATTAQAQPAPAGLSDRTAAKRDAGARPETRDWSKVDANGDHLVSPDEMEAYLKANPGPLRGGKSS